MDELNQQEWQYLHRRVIMGDQLSGGEQAIYEAALRRLDAEERLDGDLERIRVLRSEITAAENEQRHLRERKAALDARIATLESCLDMKTRELLGIGS